MKYKIEVDVPFTDKLNETIHYQIGDMIKTPVDEKRKENIVARGLGHVVEEIDTTDKEAKKKAEEAKKKAEEEAAKKLAEEEAAKKKASENPTEEK